MYGSTSRRRLLVLGGAAAAAGFGSISGPTSAAGLPVLLINPNSNAATTDMMVKIAQAIAPSGMEIVGATAPRSPMMIVDPEALAASAPQVVEIGIRRQKEASGIIVSAFGDPGVTALKGTVTIPVVGIAEAAMLAASEGGRRFAIATTTPKLVPTIDGRAAELGLAKLYAGTRVTTEDPNTLVADPKNLIEALRKVVADCISVDKAEAVIIGGGPLGNAATALTPMFSVPVIAPIPAAVRKLSALTTVR